MSLFRRRSPPTVDFEKVAHIHARRFPSADRGRFLELWCQIAEICETAPEELHEDERIVTVPPEELFLNDRVEGLLDLVLRESRGDPTSKHETLGDLMDFLLDPNHAKRVK